MELLYANYVNTTTQIGLQSNTILASNIINPERQLQYFSDGYDNDLTTTSITISFNATTAISRVALLEHNLKDFQIFYNGATANYLSLTAGGNTGTANWSANSLTSNYLQLAATINVTSLTFDLRKTIVANNEKAIGHIIVSEVALSFGRLPNASGYTPNITPKQVVHTMSDGGIKINTLKEKWSVKLSYQNIDETNRDLLKGAYDLHKEFIFVPFGTATGWDKIAFPCVWLGAFGFYKYSSDVGSAGGYTGSIDLKEVAT